MYQVIVMDASGREFLVAVKRYRNDAEEAAHELRRKWTFARVSCAVDSVEIVGSPVHKWETS